MSASSATYDTGWAWVVVFGAFISHFLTCGYEKGYSILYVEIIDKYNTTAALAAGLSGISAAIRLLLAPVSVTLSNNYTEQKVVILGGILCFAGLVIAALSTKFYGVVLGYGILFGFGLTLVYTPSLTICTTYFKRRRSTAISLSLSGCGFAALTLPYLIVYLVDEFTYSGAVLILASLSLHYSVAGALYRSIQTYEDEKSFVVESRNKPFSSSHHIRILKVCAATKDCVCSCDKVSMNPWVLVFLFSFCFNMMGSGPVTTLLIHHAEQLGYKRMLSVQLLAIEGIAQIFIRVFTGLVFDHPRIKPYRGIVWSVTIALSSLIILLLAYANTLWFLSLLMCLRGITLAIYISQQAVIAADMCENSPETLKQTIGLTQIGKGIGVLAGSWISGVIRDVTQQYRSAFLFLSLMQFVGSLTAGMAVINVIRSARSDTQTAGQSHKRISVPHPTYDKGCADFDVNHLSTEPVREFVRKAEDEKSCVQFNHVTSISSSHCELGCPRSNQS